jgi:hypothetical protein
LKTFVFAVTINKYDDEKPLKVLHFIARSAFEIAHIVDDYIWGGGTDEFKDSMVEITSISRVPGIVIANSPLDDEEDDEHEYTGQEPLRMAENMPNDRVIVFKCPCHEELRVADGHWPYVTCPNCSTQILRREIVDVGGIYVFQKFDPKRK